jgi:nucleotide-binding universal stress UspA family protein
MAYRRILVTTDGSPLSRKAVRSAVELAAATGAELVAFHVVPRYPTSYFEGGVAALSHAEIGRVEKEWAAQGEAVVDAAKDMATAAGVKAKGAIARADRVGEAVIAAVHKHKCDLVVMASHGRRGIKRLLLGSETQHVLTHSDVPVLVLR